MYFKIRRENYRQIPVPMLLFEVCHDMKQVFFFEAKVRSEIYIIHNYILIRHLPSDSEVRTPIGMKYQNFKKYLHVSQNTESLMSRSLQGDPNIPNSRKLQRGMFFYLQQKRKTLKLSETQKFKDVWVYLPSHKIRKKPFFFVFNKIELKIIVNNLSERNVQQLEDLRSSFQKIYLLSN